VARGRSGVRGRPGRAARYRRGVTVLWTTAFVDLPAPVHARGTAFWAAVTGTSPSAPRGDADQFATLLPPDGDAFVRVQRLGDASRIHLDLHVDRLDERTRQAEALGARVLLREEHTVLASPGGLVHCLVRDAGERVRPAPVTGSLGGRSRLDQVCLDVPAGLLDAEVRYWEALTDRPAACRGEFLVLDRPAGMPLRLMLQELGADDARSHVAAHLDVACGDHVGTVAAEHVALGAEVVDAERYVWTVMRDPAGLLYCLTPRDPGTGLTA